MMARCISSLLFFLLMSVAPVPCGAQASDRQAAKELFKEGNQLRWKKEYARALRSYEQAYRLFPSYKILLNMGLTLQDTGRHTEAAAFFERFIMRGAGQSPKEMVQLAQEQLAELRGKLGRLWVSCPVQGVLVVVDGKKVGFTPVARWVYLEPGKHRLALSAKGYAPLTRDLSLAAGQALDVPVRLVPRQAGDKEVVKQPETQTVSEALLLQRRSRKTRWAYVGLGTGLALATTGAVLLILGIDQGESAHANYLAAAESSPPGDLLQLEEYDTHKEAARTKVIVGDILLGAAAVALGFSIYQFATRPAAGGSRDRGTRSVTLSPVRGGATVFMGMSF